ncbi:hypothetical protein Pelo_3702 [Pelomyxa schiedti]|nr:hypothetical protein Pelo_3702 [Pelomyxa schiedti]
MQRAARTPTGGGPSASTQPPGAAPSDSPPARHPHHKQPPPPPPPASSSDPQSIPHPLYVPTPPASQPPQSQRRQQQQQQHTPSPPKPRSNSPPRRPPPKPKSAAAAPPPYSDLFPAAAPGGASTPTISSCGDGGTMPLSYEDALETACKMLVYAQSLAPSEESASTLNDAVVLIGKAKTRNQTKRLQQQSQEPVDSSAATAAAKSDAVSGAKKPPPLTVNELIPRSGSPLSGAKSPGIDVASSLSKNNVNMSGSQKQARPSDSELPTANNAKPASTKRYTRFIKITVDPREIFEDDIFEDTPADTKTSPKVESAPPPLKIATTAVSSQYSKFATVSCGEEEDEFLSLTNEEDNT